jgi:hypothetical protein
MQQLELVKVICQSVVAVREDGQIVHEIEGERLPAYTPDQLQAYYERALEEVKQQNEAMAAAAGNGNRAARRGRKEVPAP